MSVFTFIREKVDIFDVVSKRVKLRRLGAYWKGSCPFHAETDASFTISPEKKIFYCFGCHEGGDAVSFVAKIENVGQIEALEILAKEFSIKVPQELLAQSFSDPKNKDELTAARKACSVFAGWASDQLLKSSVACGYLKNRGVNKSSIERFNLGFFPGKDKAVDALLKFASKQGVLGKDLVKAGILSEQGRGFWSPFFDRILFPIRGSDGKTVGFGGRVVLPDDTRPKYYNSKESEIFHKGSILFGLDLAKHEARKSENGFLVEGYMDCVAMSQAGFGQTFATLGTACTTNQIKTISRFLKTLYVIYDADKAGEAAVLKLAKNCWDVEIDLKVIALPAGQDPASFLQDGGDLQSLVGQALGIFEFFLKRTGDKFSGASVCQKLSMTRDVIKAIGQLTDLVKRDLLFLEASRIFQLPLSSLKKGNVSRVRPVATTEIKNLHQPTDQVRPEAKDGSMVIAKQILFMHICAVKAKIEGFDIPEEIKGLLAEGKVGEILTIWAKNVLDKANNAQFDDFLNNLSEDDRTWVLKGMLRSEQSLDKSSFVRLIHELKKRSLKRFILSARQRVTGAGSRGDGDHSDVLKKICRLSKKIRSGST